MKKCFLISALFLIQGVCWSQEWQTDLKKALQEANSSNKKVLLYFSVPEFCDSCQMLEKNVFSSEEFKSFAAENYVLTKADFSNAGNPELMEENLLIVEKYNKDGFFPLVVLMDKTARVLGKTGAYNDENAAAYIKLLKSLER